MSSIPTQVSAATFAEVPVNSLTSTDITGGWSDVHHVGIVFSTEDTAGFQGSLHQLPGLKNTLARFPMVTVEAMQIVWRPTKAGASFAASLTAAGSAMTVARARGKKQNLQFGSNNYNVFLVQSGDFTFGDGISRQIQPVASTAVQPYLFMAGAGAADVTLHVYFRTKGPMDMVVFMGNPSGLAKEGETYEDYDETEVPEENQVVQAPVTPAHSGRR